MLWNRARPKLRRLASVKRAWSNNASAPNTVQRNSAMFVKRAAWKLADRPNSVCSIDRAPSKTACRNVVESSKQIASKLVAARRSPGETRCDRRRWTVDRTGRR